MRSGYSSRILLISSVPMPEPVPPPSEWHTWKPARMPPELLEGQAMHQIAHHCCRLQHGGAVFLSLLLALCASRAGQHFCYVSKPEANASEIFLQQQRNCEQATEFCQNHAMPCDIVLCSHPCSPSSAPSPGGQVPMHHSMWDSAVACAHAKSCWIPHSLRLYICWPVVFGSRSCLLQSLLCR